MHHIFFVCQRDESMGFAVAMISFQSCDHDFTFIVLKGMLLPLILIRFVPVLFREAQNHGGSHCFFYRRSANFFPLFWLGIHVLAE